MGLGTFIAGVIAGVIGSSLIPIPVVEKAKDVVPWKTIGQLVLEGIIHLMEYLVVHLKGVN